MCTQKLQKRHSGSDFALLYILLLRSCRLIDAFVISPLLFRVVEGITMIVWTLPFNGVTCYHGYYGPPHHPLAFLFHFPGTLVIEAYFASAISRPGQGGLPQLLWTSCAAVPPLTPRWSAAVYQSGFAFTCRLHLLLKSSAFRIFGFRGYLCVHLRCSPAGHSPFYKALSADFRMLVSRYPAAQVTEF